MEFLLVLTRNTLWKILKFLLLQNDAVLIVRVSHKIHIKTFKLRDFAIKIILNRNTLNIHTHTFCCAAELNLCLYWFYIVPVINETKKSVKQTKQSLHLAIQQ